MIKVKTNKFLYGMDISLSCTGVVIYDLEEKEFVYIGSFSTDKVKKQKNRYHNSLKLKAKADWLLALKEQFPPFYIAIERGFSRFPTSTQNIFRVHGLTNYLFYDCPTEYYPPSKVKERMVHGDATKEDVENTIKAKYNYIFSNGDESDAFAVTLAALIDNELIVWEKPDFKDIVAMRKAKEPKKQRETKEAKEYRAKTELLAKKTFLCTYCPSFLEKEELDVKTKFTTAEMYKAYAAEVFNVLVDEYGMTKKAAKQLMAKDKFKADFMKDWRDFEFVEPSEVARVMIKRTEDENG
jgi:hypothetical protein